MKRFELLPGEQIIIQNPIHWRNYILPVTAMVGCLVGVGLRLAFPDESLLNLLPESMAAPPRLITLISHIEAIAMLMVFVVMCFVVINLAYTRYYVTNKRIIASSGWLNVRTSDMLLDRCETVSLSQRMGERFFNSGDILCVSAGANIYLNDVYNARAFRQTIMARLVELDELREEEREERRHRRHDN